MTGFPTSISGGEIRVEVYDNLKYPEFGRLCTEHVVTVPSGNLHRWSQLADDTQLLLTYWHIVPTGGGVVDAEVGYYNVPEGTKNAFKSYVFGMDGPVTFCYWGDGSAARLHEEKSNAFSPPEKGWERAHDVLYKPLGLSWGQLSMAAQVLGCSDHVSSVTEVEEGKCVTEGWITGKGGVKVRGGHSLIVSGHLVLPNDRPSLPPFFDLWFRRPNVIRRVRVDLT